jgi:selenoprotein W-related protein
LLSELKQQIKSLKLVPAGGGCFELTADGELLYSKLQTGTFPDEKAMLDLVASRLK